MKIIAGVDWKKEGKDWVRTVTLDGNGFSGAATLRVTCCAPSMLGAEPIEEREFFIMIPGVEQFRSEISFDNDNFTMHDAELKLGEMVGAEVEITEQSKWANP